MTKRFLPKTSALIAGAWERTVRARMWVVLQLIGVALLIALGLAWTRIPEKHVGHVLLTILVPLLIATAFLLLQAGTIRSMLAPIANDSHPRSDRIGLVWGAATLLLWLLAGWLLWLLVDRFDAHIENWAGYLNSRFDPALRSHLASYAHISSWLGKTAWVLRWVIVPGFLLPLGCSAAFGLRRLPWKRIDRVWIDWRWWPVVLVLALAGQAWPGTFFDAIPHGTVHAQVGRVVLKITVAYFLAVVSWILSLAWSAALLAGNLPHPGDGLEPVAEPALLSPRGGRSDSVRLPLPE